VMDGDLDGFIKDLSDGIRSGEQ